MNEATDPTGVNERPAPAESVSRRSFLGVLVGFGAAVMGAALSVPLIRFALHPLVATTTKIGWSDVGKLDEFTSLAAPAKRLIRVEQRDAWRKIVSEKAVYVMPPKDGTVRVLSPICPHLGCSVAWHENQNKFVCPCHGGQFGPDGRRLSGPPPRGLDTLDAQVIDGKLQVQFQYFRSNVPDRELLS